LGNWTFPFIRYDLGDQVVSLAGDCACGSLFTRVADIGGRRDDDFRYGTTRVPPIAFRHLLGTDPRVSQYQVTQTATGADIVVVGVPDVSALTSALIAALRRYGLSEPKIRIQVVERLQRHQDTGKLRRFVPLPPVG
jgi:phenylacetate-CoA ligase